MITTLRLLVITYYRFIREIESFVSVASKFRIFIQLSPEGEVNSSGYIPKTRRVGVYSYFEKGCRKKCTRQSRKYRGWFLVHCFSKKFQTMAREAMDVCFLVLKESNKSRFDSYSVRNSVLIISHITFWDCRVHSFSDNLSRNSCISIWHCSPTLRGIFFFQCLLNQLDKKWKK